MRTHWHRHWPFWIATAAFLVLTTVLLVDMVRMADGQLVYARDDTYIHLAISKTLAEHGVWGVSPAGFSSTSSSPLWTILLAVVFRITGARTWVPLALNLLAAVAAIGAAHVFLRRWRLAGWQILVTLLLFAYVTPLHALATFAMEHTLHLALVLIFVLLGYPRVAADPEGAVPPLSRWIWPVTVLMVMTRYESLALIALLAALLFWRGHRSQAGALIAVALLPVIAYGLVAVGHGWPFLPATILIKSDIGRSLASVTEAGLSFGERVEPLYALVFKSLHKKFAANQVMSLVVFLGILLLFNRLATRTGRLGPGKTVAILVVGTALAHLQFGAIRVFYRYEAYVIGLACVGLAPLAWQSWRDLTAGTPRSRAGIAHGVALAAVIVFCLGPFLSRGGRSLYVLPRASANHLDQQLQLGRFVAEHYPGVPVAANDIGAINFLSDADCLDLVGLSSLDVFEDRRRGQLAPEMIERWTTNHGTRIAMVYDAWFGGGDWLPDHWEKVGSWSIGTNYICADREVSFYAVAAGEAPVLREKLRAYSSRLSDRVEQSGPYRQDEDGSPDQ